MRHLRIIILSLVILMVSVAAFATDIPSGTGNYEVLFPGYRLNPYGAINCVALKFYDADVSIEFFYDGVQVDSVRQNAGDGVTYTTPCDSINIIRTDATGGVYLLGTADGKFCPQINNGIESYMSDISNDEGFLKSYDLTTTQVSSADTLAHGDTLLIDGGMIGEYRRIYVKVLADTFAKGADSLDVYIASSESGSWDAGNTAFWDFIPSTAPIDGYHIGGLGVYGKIFALNNKTGGDFIAGDHLLLMVINHNTDVGSTGDESNCSKMSFWILKTK